MERLKISCPNHVALLVRSVERSAKFLQQFGFQIGEAECWDGEGTKEIYIERERANSLLLMEPVKAGAYRRALEKRGPGVHHLAVDVTNLEDFVTSISGSGWLLHPMSIKTIRQTKTAYLARPGFPALIEVQEKPSLCFDNPFVTKVGMLMDQSLQRLAKEVGLQEVVSACDSSPWIEFGGRRLLLHEILDPVTNSTPELNL